MSNELAVKFEHVSKEYRLGAIGGGTLRGDLQSWVAKKKGLEDPNSKIGSESIGRTGEKFLALNDISFEVKKGEALGIIGHNGAGKSTLLKLLSRVTAPTTGKISYNGRIASMLEVGTGFHPELTGRENVYMNGAILGMTKAEIDKKFDEIVAFAEMEQFIDTPVKRYSSGMYVKLAFAVAAHLDSEILVMDEVLAVGDLKFQQKCLGRMGDAAQHEGRTVLYVSHNMNTIRQLCDRCIVLEHGKLIFNGNVEEAISLYSEQDLDDKPYKQYTEYVRPKWLKNDHVRLQSARIINKKSIIFKRKEPINIEFTLKYERQIDNVGLKYEVSTRNGIAVATSIITNLPLIPKEGLQTLVLQFDMSNLVAGEYKTIYTFFTKNDFGNETDLDCVEGINMILEEDNFADYIDWNSNNWGFVQLPKPIVIND